MVVWRTYARPLALLVALGAMALLLIAAGPRLDLLVALGHHPQASLDATDADAAALALAGAAAWLVLGWLTLGLLLTAAAQCPGSIGRVARRTADRALPRTVRRVIALAIGLSLVTGTGAGAAASAAPGSPAAWGPAAALNLDWPAGPGERAAARIPRPPARPPHSAHPAVLAVAPTDSLWSIAARSLPPGASNAQIAAEWPRWYATNRAIIGPDPSLICPGQQLHSPTPRRPA